MADWEIDERFDTAANADVLAFVRETKRYAHSDVAEKLIQAAEGLPGVAWYCPDSRAYAFVVLHRGDDMILGIAYGQSALAFRLPEDRVEGALADGGTAAAEIGSGWVRFQPWASPEPLDVSLARLKRWCAVAAGAR